MTEIEQLQGNDIPLTFTLPGISEINDLDNLLIMVYKSDDGTPLTKFSLVGTTGYEGITITDSANRIVDVIIPSEDTKAAETETYDFEYRAIRADTSFKDGYDDVVNKIDDYCLVLLESQIADDTWTP